jgi:A/G-specific adenine glycosylase
MRAREFLSEQPGDTPGIQNSQTSLGVSKIPMGQPPAPPVTTGDFSSKIETFLKRNLKYPNIKKLAVAPESEVFKLWEGLGYYSRCKNLLHTARYISNYENGKFPDNYNKILKLKGIGPYTAAAISSFAYNHPYSVLDGNVMRVLARFFGIDTPLDSNEGKKIFSSLAQDLLDKNRSAIYNQAIMDFGATVCKPKLAACAKCMLAKHCVAYKTKSVEDFPIKTKKIIKKTRWFNYFIVSYKDKVFVRKRTGEDIWQNLNEFFLIESAQKMPFEEITKTEHFINNIGREYNLLNVSDYIKQQLTHQTIYGCFISIELKSTIRLEGYDLVNKKSLKSLPFPRLINSFLENLITQ